MQAGQPMATPAKALSGRALPPWLQLLRIGRQPWKEVKVNRRMRLVGDWEFGSLLRFEKSHWTLGMAGSGTGGVARTHLGRRHR